MGAGVVWLLVAWIVGCFTTAAALFVWALIEDRCRKDQPWWEDQ